MKKLEDLLSKRNATTHSFNTTIKSITIQKGSAKCDCDCTAGGNCNCSRCDW